VPVWLARRPANRNGCLSLCKLAALELRSNVEEQKMSNRFILVGKVPKPADDLAEWTQWLWNEDSNVAHDFVGDTEIRTVFLGIDYRLDGGEPLLFETEIFGGPYDQYQRRCSTWEQAEAQHAEAVKLATSLKARILGWITPARRQ
jgi:hypothetical protein